MNTENTISSIAEMISSESYYVNLIDMINDMDLELTDFTL